VSGAEHSIDPPTFSYPKSHECGAKTSFGNLIFSSFHCPALAFVADWLTCLFANQKKKIIIIKI